MGAFDSIYSHGPAVAIERDPRNIWQIISVSENISRLGYTPAFFSGERVDLLTLIHDQDREMAAGRLGGAVLQKRSEISLRYRIKVGKTYRWVEDACHLLFSATGLESVSSLLWCTPLPLEWNLLAKGSSTWNVMNSKVRHDILNQLTAVLGYLELSSDMITDPVLREFTQKEQTAADKIREKLIFTREYQNIGLGEYGWVNLFDSIQEALNEAGCIKIPVNLSVPSVQVFTDKNFVHALTKIFENIPEHATGATLISISFSLEEGSGQLVIADNGPGIAEKLKSRIFDLGYGEGNGFGLFLAEKLLSVFGISLIENGVPGSSARFEMTIPTEILSFMGEQTS